MGGDRPSTRESKPLSGLLIQDRQALQPPSIGGLVRDKVIAPDVRRRRRTGRRGRARAHGAPFARFPDDLQPLVLPDAADRRALPPLVQPFTGSTFSESQSAESAPRG